MEYSEAVNFIMVAINQYKHGYTITQSDYNNFTDALELLERIKNKIEVTK